MAAPKLDNAAPTVYESTKERELVEADYDDEIEDAIDQREIFGMHMPMSLFLFINLLV